MFNFKDATPALEAKQEVLIAYETRYEFQRRDFLYLAIGLPFLSAAVVWFNPPADDRVLLSVAIYLVMQTSLLALWIHAWVELSHVRGILKGVEGLLDKRPDVDQYEFAEEGSAGEEEYGQASMRVKLICQSTMSSAEGLGDPDPEVREYELSRYLKRRDEAITLASEIRDEFYRGFAVHQIAILCRKANDLASVQPMFDAIKDDFLREKILEDVPELA